MSTLSTEPPSCRIDVEERVERRGDGALLEVGVEDDHHFVMTHDDTHLLWTRRPRSFRGRRALRLPRPARVPACRRPDTHASLRASEAVRPAHGTSAGTARQIVVHRHEAVRRTVPPDRRPAPGRRARPEHLRTDRRTQMQPRRTTSRTGPRAPLADEGHRLAMLTSVDPDGTPALREPIGHPATSRSTATYLLRSPSVTPTRCASILADPRVNVAYAASSWGVAVRPRRRSADDRAETASELRNTFDRASHARRGPGQPARTSSSRSTATGAEYWDDPRRARLTQAVNLAEAKVTGEQLRGGQRDGRPGRARSGRGVDRPGGPAACARSRLAAMAKLRHRCPRRPVDPVAEATPARRRGAALPRRPAGLPGPRGALPGGAGALRVAAQDAGVALYVHAPTSSTSRPPTTGSGSRAASCCSAASRRPPRSARGPHRPRRSREPQRRPGGRLRQLAQGGRARPSSRCRC